MLAHPLAQPPSLSGVEWLRLGQRAKKIMSTVGTVCVSRTVLRGAAPNQKHISDQTRFSLATAFRFLATRLPRASGGAYSAKGHCSLSPVSKLLLAHLSVVGVAVPLLYLLLGLVIEGCYLYHPANFVHFDV